MGNNSRTYLYGLGLDFNIPAFSHLIVMISRLRMIPPTRFPFLGIANAKLKFQGYVDLAGTEKNNSLTKKSSLLVSSELLLDIGHL